MDKVNNPHDAFFKRLFGNLGIATDFLRNYLPGEIRSQIDLESLQIEKESFIDPDLRNCKSTCPIMSMTFAMCRLSINDGDEIKGGPKLRAGLQLMRFIFSPDLGRRLREVFQHLRGMSREDALEYARTLLAYVSSAGRNVDKEEVNEAMQEVFTGEEFDKSALFIRQWMEEGRQLGEHQGVVFYRSASNPASFRRNRRSDARGDRCAAESEAGRIGRGHTRFRFPCGFAQMAAGQRW